MTRLSFETTIERENDSIDVDVIYTVTPYRPAVLYGDYPQPAEGGEIEIISVLPSGAAKGSPQLDLTEAENETLTDEAHERANSDLAEEQAAKADYLYDMRRDELLENNE